MLPPEAYGRLIALTNGDLRRLMAALIAVSAFVPGMLVIIAVVIAVVVALARRCDHASRRECDQPQQKAAFGDALCI
jgi:hypothetical protein